VRLEACSRRTPQNRSKRNVPIAEKNESKLPTHRAYSVIRREGQDDFWLNIGLVFPHKDNGGFNIVLQALPLDGKIVCREVSEGDEAGGPIPSSSRSKHSTGRGMPNSNRR